MYILYNEIWRWKSRSWIARGTGMWYASGLHLDRCFDWHKENGNISLWNITASDHFQQTVWHSTYTRGLLTCRRKGDVCISPVPFSKGCTRMNKKVSLFYYPVVPAVIIYLWNIDVSSVKPCLVNLCLVPVNQNNTCWMCWMGHIKLLTTWSITFLWTLWFFVISRMTTNTYMKER